MTRRSLVFGILLLFTRAFAQLHPNWSSTVISTNHGSPGCSHCSQTHASAAAADSEGNTYVAVAAYDSDGTNGWDTILRKYSSGGSVAWELLFRSSDGLHDFIKSIVLTNDRVFITGTEGDQGFLAAVTAHGEALWLTDQNDFGLPAIAGIADGLVTATTSRNPAKPWEAQPAVVRRFDGAGALLWSKSVGILSESKSVAVSPAGDIYVAGSRGTNQLLFRFSPSGELVWSRSHSDVNAADSYTPPSLVVDAGERVFIGSVGQVCAFDNSGMRLWTTPTLEIGRRKVLLDAEQNLFTSVEAEFAVTLMKVSKLGVVEWRSVFAKETYTGTAIATDGTNLFAAISAGTFSSPGVLAFMKFNPAGARTWFWQYEDLRPAYHDTFPLFARHGEEIHLTANLQSSTTPAGILIASFTERKSSPGPRLGALPPSRVVTNESSVEFAISAEGTGPLSYRWLQNGSPFYQATNSSLVFSNVGVYQAGAYAVEVTDANGTTCSPTFYLAVFVPPVSQETVRGGTATFRAQLAGTSASQLEWRRDGQTVRRANMFSSLYFANTFTLVLTNAHVADAGLYSIRFVDGFGVSHEFSAELTVSTKARLAWSRSFPGTRAVGLALDRFDNPCVVVNSNFAQSYAFLLSRDGKVKSAKSTGGFATALAFDSRGHFYLHAGHWYSSLIGVMQFAPRLGGLRWFHTNHFAAYRASPSLLRVDDEGNAYSVVHGTTRSATSPTFFSVLKSARGGIAGLVGGGGDWGSEDVSLMELGRDNDIYLLTQGYYGSPQKLWRIERSDDPRNWFWQRRFSQTEGWMSAMTVDRHGHLLLAGYHRAGGVVAGEPRVMTLTKIAADSNAVWSVTLTNRIFPARVRIDGEDNIVVAGGDGAAKFDAAGHLLWIANAGGQQLEFDGVNNIYLARRTTMGPADVETTMLNPAGEQIWQTRFNSPQDGDDSVSGLSVSDRGEVYVGVAIDGYYGAGGAMVLKYSPHRGK